jgi:long-chain acyl-CoA synthetase
MSHGSGLYVLPHVAHAAVHVAPESGGFDPDEVYALLRRWPGATMFAAPTMVKRLVDHPGESDAANLKTVVYGGGPMYVEECKRALARFGYKLVQIYGQGESPMTITALGKHLHAGVNHPRYEQLLGSVGIAHTGMEVRVAGPDDCSLPEGEPGEVLVRGDAVMRGYWQNEPATAETLRGGWLHTADMGWMDSEGYICMLGRWSERIVSHGQVIFPRAMEEALYRHPAVRYVAVIGKPDPKAGEIPKAIVALYEGKSATPDELLKLCHAQLGAENSPALVEIIPEMPMTPTGKIAKADLQRRERELAAG